MAGLSVWAVLQLRMMKGTARTDAFFEPDVDRTDRIEALDLDVYYGYCRSYITDSARQAHEVAMSPSPSRLLRLPFASHHVGSHEALAWAYAAIVEATYGDSARAESLLRQARGLVTDSTSRAARIVDAVSCVLELTLRPQTP